MTTTVDGDGLGPFDDRPKDRGPWLIANRWAMDRGECGWLVELGWFDREDGWLLDGQTGIIPWLRWRTGLARPTAYEKLRSARALLSCAVLRARFEDGRILYSAVRAISRVADAPDEVIVALCDLAEHSSTADVEQAVRFYLDLKNQDLPPDKRWAARKARVGGPVAGLRHFDALVLETEGDLIEVTINCFRDRIWRRDHQAQSEVSAPADTPTTDTDTPKSEDEARVSAPADTPAPPVVSNADALMAIFDIAMAHIDDLDHHPTTSGDNTLVHYVHHADTGLTTRMDGTLVHPETAGPILCDTGRVDHTVGPNGEPLSLGRKTREWSTAQRRAITRRDGGRCRFPGCDHKTVQIHHVHHWNHGGPTDVTNGVCLCPRHHALHHAGFVIEGQPDGTLYFARPDGTPIATTHPQPASGPLPGALFQ